MSHQHNICCYADDSTYSKSDHNPEVLRQDIDAKYQEIASYIHRNKLVLNGDKTHLLVMTSATNHRNHGDYDIVLNTGNEIIKPIQYEKLLGGYISNNFKWNENIRENKKSIFKTVTTRINALSKISKFSNFKTRKAIANDIIMSKFIQLIQLWGGCSEYLLIFFRNSKIRLPE